MYGAHVRAAPSYIKSNASKIFNILNFIRRMAHMCEGLLFLLILCRCIFQRNIYCGPLPIVGRGACAFMILLKFRKLNGECAARIESEGVQRGLRV